MVLHHGIIKRDPSSTLDQSDIITNPSLASIYSQIMNVIVAFLLLTTFRKWEVITPTVSLLELSVIVGRPYIFAGFKWYKDLASRHNMAGITVDSLGCPTIHFSGDQS